MQPLWKCGSLPEIIYTADSGKEFYPLAYPYYDAESVKDFDSSSDESSSTTSTKSTTSLASSKELTLSWRTTLCHFAACFLIVVLTLGITGIYVYYTEQGNPCEVSPCLLNQTCKRTTAHGTYECVCPAGFYGDQCEKTFSLIANVMMGTGGGEDQEQEVT